MTDEELVNGLIHIRDGMIKKVEAINSVIVLYGGDVGDASKKADFDIEAKCRECLELHRWPIEPCCSFCHSTRVTKFATDAKTYKCKDCRNKFTVTSGTPYENTKIPLIKWFLATHRMLLGRGPISSVKLSQWLEITQPTAWLMQQRIRDMIEENH